MKSHWNVASICFWDGSVINLTTDGSNYYIHDLFNNKAYEFSSEVEAKIVFRDIVDEVIGEKFGVD